MFGFFLSAVLFVLVWTLGILFFITRIFSVLRPYRSWILSGGTLLSLCFVASMGGADYMSTGLTSWLYKIGASWLGGITIAGFVALGFLIIGIISRQKWTSWQSVRTFLIIVLLVNAWGTYATLAPHVVESTVSFGTKEHGWHGKKIVMFSDTHYGYIHSTKSAERLVKLVNSLNPDIVLIPGDFFDGPKIDFGEITDILAKIRSKEGIYFANGNHEEYQNTESMLQALENAGVHILNNRVTTVDGVQIAGVTYHATEYASELAEILDSLHLDPAKPTILLKHKPTLIDTVADYPIDLGLSGHTHKAQMWPFSYITTLMFGKYAYGTHAVNDRLTWITSSGVGTWGPPQRIGSRSEVMLIAVE